MSIGLGYGYCLVNEDSLLKSITHPLLVCYLVNAVVHQYRLLASNISHSSRSANKQSIKLPVYYHADND